MSGSVDQRAVEIARQVLATGPGERADRLASLCRGDGSLRQRVEEILVQQEARTVVGRPAPAAPPAPSRRSGPVREEPPSAPRGRMLGEYEILGMLGEGGMGVVYRARQRRPEREVALKVVRPGWMTPAMLRRFDLESQLLARLQHPGIAAVHEAGTFETESGPQPYFAMELVRGEPLVQWARRARPDRRRRLELFVALCDAVQHAHQKGVLHRDLKPANVMVDESGRPRILDFGVARATDADVHTVQTEVGQVLGTIPYMSPEQIAGDPDATDTRSDVYALGVILYELLAGRLPLPLAGTTLAQAARLVAEEPPTALSRHDASLRGDLETICRKALEKDRERRYRSASELAEDVQRHLRDEPIAARAPSALYQARKFARRHRALCAGATAALLLLLLGTAGTTAGLLASIRAERRADAAAQDAIAVNDFLIRRLLLAASPEESRGREMTVREVFDRASAELDDAFPDQPLVRATLRGTLGEAYFGLGSIEEAEREYVAALALRRAALGPDSLEAAIVEGSLGSLLSRTRADDRAAEHLAHAAEVFAAREGLSERYWTTLVGLAVVRSRGGAMEEAESLMRRAVAGLDEASGPDAAATLSASNNLAFLLHDLGRPGDALPFYRRALEGRRRTLGADHPHTLMALSNVGVALWDLGDAEGARSIAQESWETQRRVLGADHPDTLVALNNLAFLTEAAGRLEEAAGMYRDAVATTVAALGADHPQTAGVRGNLASVLAKLGEDVDAEAEYRAALASLERSVGVDHADTMYAVNNLGGFLLERGRVEEAAPYVERAAARRTELLGAGHPVTLPSRFNLARLRVAQGRHEEGMALAEEVSRAAEDAWGAEHRRTVEMRGWIAAQRGATPTAS